MTAFVSPSWGVPACLSPLTNELSSVLHAPTACMQVVVSHNELAGQRLKDVKFRQTYGAAVLGIHRQGEPSRRLYTSWLQGFPGCNCCQVWQGPNGCGSRCGIASWQPPRHQGCQHPG